MIVSNGHRRPGVFRFMKPIKILVVLAIVTASGIAAAQPVYYTTVPARDPQGFHRRANHLTWGFSVGLGYMNDNGQRIECTGCDVAPLSGYLEGHIGGMLNNRLGLMLEIQGNAQQISGYDPTSLNSSETIRQVLVMGALQYWLTPILWIKGGIGVANLDVIGDYTQYAIADSGLALMGGIGVELLSARRFALELQGRISEGVYHYDTGTDNITTGTIGLGFNWY
jgi:hypothetical protein